MNGYVVLKGKGTRDFPSYNRRYGMGVLEHDHIMEMYLGRPLDVTKECVHHKNGVKTDNRLENLELLTLSDHAKKHSIGRNYTNLIQFDTTKTHYVKNNTTVWLAPKESKVINIEYVGERQVYDVEINDSEIHNFVANSVVVHNCGKTLQAITLARYKKLHRGLKHCLIICGVNSLKWNWQREIDKFCKDEKGIVLGTTINTKGKTVSLTIDQTKEQIDSCPEQFFWIINIEKMRASNKQLKDKNTIVDYLNKQIGLGNLGMVIVDECHKIKNILSSQANGIMHLDKSISKMLMSGTLLVNNPNDLFCPMCMCGLLQPNKWIFENKYFLKDEFGQVYGYKNMEELHSILFKNSLRRTKDMLDLPPKVYKQEWLEFNKDELNVFEQITGARPFMLDKIDEPFETLAIITRMRQATVACELLTSKKVQSTKFDRLNDILEEAKINNQKVLVFCPFTEALKLGLEYCKEYKPKIVCGGMGNLIQQTVDIHENTNGFSVLFAQESTLGVGYTLKNTSIVVFLSPPWSQASYDQCVDRTHRIGQKQTVQVIDLLIKDTYDETIYKKLHGKGAMSKALIDGDEVDSLRSYFRDMNIVFEEKEHIAPTSNDLLTM